MADRVQRVPVTQFWLTDVAFSMHFIKQLLAFVIMFSFFNLFSRKAEAQDLDSLVRSIQSKHDLVAFGALLIEDGEVRDISVSGARKLGDPTPATADDKWHLGSDTKAFTSTLIGILVERGVLRWDLTIAEALPELRDSVHADYRNVTLEMLLAHYGGTPGETWPYGYNYFTISALEGDEPEQRRKYAQLILTQAPEAKPGTKAIYSNAGYTVAGAIAERATGKSYALLLAQFIFKPLGIMSAGYGAMNTEGQVDQPWAHESVGKKKKPHDIGLGSDNPPAITPAGRLHMTLRDWARFATLQFGGHPEIISDATLAKLHSRPFGGDFGLGWISLDRSWANGIALTHDGSNGMNYASIWLAPARKFALLMVSNEGTQNAAKACQELVGAIVKQKFLK